MSPAERGRGSRGRGRGQPPAARRRPARGTVARGSARGTGGGVPAPAPVVRRAPRGLGGEQVEGRQAVRELLIAGRRKVREIWMASDLDDAGIVADIITLASQARVPVQEVSRRALDAEARSEAPQGVLAKAAPLPEADLDSLATKRTTPPQPFVVALDGVTDPGNVGALLRTAEGAGVTGVVLPRHRAAHITPTVAKAAAGAIEYLDIAVVGGLPAALARAKQLGCWIVGLDDAADRRLFDLDDLAAEPVVLVLGAEGAGLSRLVRERCDVLVSIPMRGRIGSLNVASAGALACYEIARRR